MAMLFGLSRIKPYTPKDIDGRIVHTSKDFPVAIGTFLYY